VSKEVVAALITAGVSLLVALLSLWWSRKNQDALAKHKRKNQEALAELQHRYQTETAERDARRDYEYAARKRLYDQCEPLLFQLAEASGAALSQIEAIADRARAGNLGTDGWLSKDGYFLKATIYWTLLPSAIYKLIARRLTIVDLRVDERVHAHYVLARAIYYSNTHDDLLARLSDPPLKYTPYAKGWREKRLETPHTYYRQGFTPGRLDNTLEEMITTNGAEDARVLSFGRFEEKLKGVQDTDVSTGLGVARDMFFGFHPASRPILWRTLVAQAVLHTCLLKLAQDPPMSSGDVLGSLGQLPDNERTRFDWRSNPQEFAESLVFEPFAVATRYISLHVKPALESVASRVR